MIYRPLQRTWSSRLLISLLAADISLTSLLEIESVIWRWCTVVRLLVMELSSTPKCIYCVFVVFGKNLFSRPNLLWSNMIAISRCAYNAPPPDLSNILTVRVLSVSYLNLQRWCCASILCSLVLYNLRDNVKVRFNFDVTNIKSH